MNFITKNIYTISIYLTPFLFLLSLYSKRKKRIIKKTVIPKYEIPREIHPSFVGIIVDGVFHKRDFIAGIMDLAIAGFMKIETIKQGSKTEYFLREIKNKKTIEGFRKIFYDFLFSDKYLKRMKNETEGIFINLHQKELNCIREYMFSKIQDHYGKYFEPGVLKLMSSLPFLFNKKRSLVHSDLRLSALFFLLILIICFFLWHGRNHFNMVMYLPSLVLPFVFFAYFIFVIKRIGKSPAGEKITYEIKCYNEFLSTIGVNTFKSKKASEYEENIPYMISLGIAESLISDYYKHMNLPDWNEEEDLDENKYTSFRLS